MNRPWLRGPRDRLAVGDPGSLGLDRDPELPLHSLELYVEVDLSEPTRNRLSELRIESRVEGRVLLVYPVQHLAQLVLVAPLCPADRHGDVGVGEPDLLQLEGTSGLTERVPVWVFRSFATTPMSPACSRETSSRSFPLRYRDVVQLLGRVPARIPDFLAVDHRARVDAEYAQLAHVRLVGGLEHQCAERRVVTGVELLISGRDRSDLGRIREELDHLPEECPHPVGLLGGPAEDRHDFPACSRESHCLDRLLPADLFAFEVTLE